MLPRARGSLVMAGLSLIAVPWSLLQPAPAEDSPEPAIPVPVEDTGAPAPVEMPPTRVPRRPQVVPRQQGGFSVQQAGAEGDAKPRVCISPGEIQVGEFLRFLGDSGGLPVIPAGISSKELLSSISIVTPIENATVEIVRAILAANGWQVEEEELAEGRKYLRVSRGGVRRPLPPPGPPPRPAPEVAKAGEEAALPVRSLVFQLDGATLRPVDARESPLGAQGVEGEEVVTVVTELRSLDPQVASEILSNVLPVVPPGDSLRMGPVHGTRRLVLTCRAHIIDRALKILAALDVKEPAAPDIKEPEPILQVFKLRHAEPDEVAATLAAFFQVDSGPAIRPFPGRAGQPVPRSVGAASRATTVHGGPETLMVSDSRTRSLIVRTIKEKDLQSIRSLLEALDAPEAEAEPGKEAAPGSGPEIRTQILQLKHAKAAQIAALIEKFVAGRGEDGRLGAQILTDERTNSLVITAGPEALDQLLRFIAVLDVASSEDAKK